MIDAVRLDSLVRGPIGTTDKVRTMRVYGVSRYGWVAGVDVESGRQYIMEEGRFEVIGDPRPLAARTDVPARLVR